jgi:hypothetical protein
MKPDGMLVEPAYIQNAHHDVTSKGGADVFAEFSQAEPALACFIQESLAVIAGKLALAGAPTEVVQGQNADVLSLLLTCVEAQRRGHYELWKDTMTGTRLAQLDKTFKPRPARRRKKSQPTDEQDTTTN